MLSAMSVISVESAEQPALATNHRMMPTDVVIEDKKKLAKPTRESISGVVKSYYDK